MLHRHLSRRDPEVRTPRQSPLVSSGRCNGEDRLPESASGPTPPLFDVIVAHLPSLTVLSPGPSGTLFRIPPGHAQVSAGREVGAIIASRRLAFGGWAALRDGLASGWKQQG
jgi:hypothetical protein